jgi:hypothetical protein
VWLVNSRLPKEEEYDLRERFAASMGLIAAAYPESHRLTHVF